MASISKILGTKKSDLPQRTPFITQQIHYTQFEASKMQFYNCDREIVEQTADNIEMAGELEAPVVVRKLDSERYEILSGHKRVAAVKILVEERGLKKFALIPAKIVKVDDEMAEYILISTNDYPRKSDYERMMEVVRLYEIIPALEKRKNKENSEEKENISARILRRLVAREASICETRVGNFTNIYKHFSPTAMEAFKNEEFGIHVAIKLASLPKDEQDMLVNQGNITMRSISEYIEGKKTESDRSVSETTEISNPEIDESRSTLDTYDEEKDDNSREDEKEGNFVDNDTQYCNTDNLSLVMVPMSCNSEDSPNYDECDENIEMDNEYNVAAEMKANAEATMYSDVSEKEKLESRIMVEALTLWLNHRH